MGDSAEFEKLAALEARLSAAFERIAKGVEARGAVPDIDAALADAQARVTEAEARADDLSQSLAARDSELTDLRTELKAAQDGAAGTSEKSAADAARIAELEAELDTARAKPAEPDNDVAALRARVDRARAERDAALAARDAAEDRADELSQGGKLDPGERVMALRGEMRRLRNAVDRMSEELDTLRKGDAASADGINDILQAQVNALKEVRRAEAAELERIIALLSSDSANGDSTTEGAKHA